MQLAFPHYIESNEPSYCELFIHLTYTLYSPSLFLLVVISKETKVEVYDAFPIKIWTLLTHLALK